MSRGITVLEKHVLLRTSTYSHCFVWNLRFTLLIAWMLGSPNFRDWSIWNLIYLGSSWKLTFPVSLLFHRKHEALFVSHTNFPPGTHLQPKTKFTKSWQVLNGGDFPFDDKTKVRFCSDILVSNYARITAGVEIHKSILQCERFPEIQHKFCKVRLAFIADIWYCCSFLL